MKIQSSIWGAPGTFPFLLAAACRGEYQQSHQPGIFPEPLARVTQTLQLDNVGRSLLFLGSDLASEAMQKRREASEALKKAAKRLQSQSKKLGHQANAATLAEESERLKKRHELVSNLLFAYVLAVTPEFENGAPRLSFNAEGQILADFDDEQVVDSALPQGHLARQAALYIVRIIAGNDDPAQTGIVDELRAFRLGINDVDAAEAAEEIGGEEILAVIEDPILQRISTLVDALTFAELGVPVTLDTIGNQIPQAAETLEHSLDLAVAIFWNILDETAVALFAERNVAVTALREDWAIVNGERLTPEWQAKRRLEEMTASLIGRIERLFGQLYELDFSAASEEQLREAREHAASCESDHCPLKKALAKIDEKQASADKEAEAQAGS